MSFLPQTHSEVVGTNPKYYVDYYPFGGDQARGYITQEINTRGGDGYFEKFYVSKNCFSDSMIWPEDQT